MSGNSCATCDSRIQSLVSSEVLSHDLVHLPLEIAPRAIRHRLANRGTGGKKHSSIEGPNKPSYLVCDLIDVAAIEGRDDEAVLSVFNDIGCHPRWGADGPHAKSHCFEQRQGPAFEPREHQVDVALAEIAVLQRVGDQTGIDHGPPKLSECVSIALPIRTNEHKGVASWVQAVGEWQEQLGALAEGRRAIWISAHLLRRKRRAARPSDEQADLAGWMLAPGM